MIILLFILLLLPSISISTQIRCYKGLKYVVGQDVFQDTEDCDAILGMGDAYCYKFSEETALNEVVKMGCSSVICNAFRNTCVESELAGMKGRLCCCNDRHYCNHGARRARVAALVVPVLMFIATAMQLIFSDL